MTRKSERQRGQVSLSLILLGLGWLFCHGKPCKAYCAIPWCQLFWRAISKQESPGCWSHSKGCWNKKCRALPWLQREQDSPSQGNLVWHVWCFGGYVLPQGEVKDSKSLLVLPELYGTRVWPWGSMQCSQIQQLPRVSALLCYKDLVPLWIPTACCSFCVGSQRRLKHKILALLQQSPLLAQPSQFFHLGATELSPPSWEHSCGKGQGSCHVRTSLACYHSTGSFYICAFIPLRPSTAAARSMFCRISRDRGGLPGEEGKRGEPSRSRERYFMTRILSYWSIRGEGECRRIS